MGFRAEQKILGHQPYSLSHGVGRSLGLPAVSRLLELGRGLEKHLLCPSPGSAAAANESHGSGNTHFCFQGWEQGRLIPVGALEEGKAGGCTGQGVVGELHPQ